MSCLLKSRSGAIVCATESQLRSTRGRVGALTVGDVLGQSLAGDRQLRAVDEIRVGENVLEHSRDSADQVQVLEDVVPAWLEVAQHRRAIADGSEVVDGELNFR